MPRLKIAKQSVLSLALCAALTQLAPGHISAQPGNVTAALADMRTIANATEVVNIDTTYYVVPEALNDLSQLNTIVPYDSIQDQGGAYVIRPEEGQFRPARINLATAFLAWGGPYLNYQQGRTQLGTTPYDQGSPLDPWGGPYYLFSPLGLLRGDTGMVSLELYGDQFDRYTLVSLGPDTIQSADDIIFQFNGGVTRLVLTSIRGESVSNLTQPPQPPSYLAEAGTSITLRGVNFGATQSTSQVIYNGAPLINITSWGPREVNLTLPSALNTQGTIAIQRGTAASNGLPLAIEPGPSSVNNWLIYE